MSEDVSTLRALTSALVERLGWASAAGLTFDGKRRMSEAFGYKQTLTPEDFRERYERNEIAGRAVDAKPEATWRGDAELIENEDSDTLTSFESAWVNLEARLNVWGVFARADKLAGLGRFAAVFIQAPGDVSTELPKRLSAEQITLLKPFAEESVTIADRDWVTSLSDARFGRPEYYTIKLEAPGAFGTIAKRVHWTRVLHIADGLLDDEVFGEPRLKRIWNSLDNLDKVAGGGSEAFWRRADPGTQFDIDPAVPVSETSKAEMTEQIDEFVHNLRRTLKTRGMKINQLGSDVANFGPQVDAILSLISAGTGIPKRILTGSEMGEMASTQDRLNWADRITDRRVQYAGPYVVRPFVDRLIERGALPKPKSYVIRWPVAAGLNDLEKAKKAAYWSQVNMTQGEDVTTSNEIRDFCFGLPKRKELDATGESWADRHQSAVPALPGRKSADDLPERPADEISDDEDEAQQRAARLVAWPRERGRVVKTIERDAEQRITRIVEEEEKWPITSSART